MGPVTENLKRLNHLVQLNEVTDPVTLVTGIFAAGMGAGWAVATVIGMAIDALFALLGRRVEARAKARAEDIEGLQDRGRRARAVSRLERDVEQRLKPIARRILAMAPERGRHVNIAQPAKPAKVSDATWRPLAKSLKIPKELAVDVRALEMVTGQTKDQIVRRLMRKLS